jgi:hypothetical protein
MKKLLVSRQKSQLETFLDKKRVLKDLCSYEINDGKL